jgi:hypothetical protein
VCLSLHSAVRFTFALVCVRYSLTMRTVLTCKTLISTYESAGSSNAEHHIINFKWAVNGTSYALRVVCAPSVQEGETRDSSGVKLRAFLLCTVFQFLIATIAKRPVIWDIALHLAYTASCPARHLLLASCWLLPTLVLWPWRWRGHVPPKRLFTSVELHCVAPYKNALQPIWLFDPKFEFATY